MLRADIILNTSGLSNEEVWTIGRKKHIIEIIFTMLFSCRVNTKPNLQAVESVLTLCWKGLPGYTPQYDITAFVTERLPCWSPRSDPGSKTLVNLWSCMCLSMAPVILGFPRAALWLCHVCIVIIMVNGCFAFFSSRLARLQHEIINFKFIHHMISLIAILVSIEPWLMV